MNPFKRFQRVLAVLVSCLLLVSVVQAAPHASTLYNFKGTIDGQFPIWYGRLAVDGKGNLYGTTVGGGDPLCFNICGTVFLLSRDQQGNWEKLTLYNFVGGTMDGAQPNAGLVFDSRGNLYGTTVQGGAQNCGTVFQLSPNQHGSWDEAVLHTFSGSDGCYPVASVIVDPAGSLYGTTTEGGANSFGVVFELSNNSGVWTETVLHSFGGDIIDGQKPYSNLAVDKNGNLFGTTPDGGTYNFGTVFEMKHNSDGSWSESAIYSFPGAGKGEYPFSGVTIDEAGHLYGTTSYGGTGTGCSPGSCGEVYRLTHAHNRWTENVLYSFKGGNDGNFPVAGVAIVGGKIYGTTPFGGRGACLLNGISGCGTIYSLEYSNGVWTETVLELNGRNGASPQAGLTVSKQGTIFGTTFYGGAGSCNGNLPGCGTIFQLLP